MLVEAEPSKPPSPSAATAALDHFLLTAEQCQQPGPQECQALTLHAHDATIAHAPVANASSAYALSDVEQSCIIDTGASSHYTTPDLALTNERPCTRKLRAAGGTVLHGTRTGNCGALTECIAVNGLTVSLCSVGTLARNLDMAVVFDATGCYLSKDKQLLSRINTPATCIATRNPETMLYVSTPQRLTQVARSLPQQNRGVVAFATLHVPQWEG